MQCRIFSPLAEHAPRRRPAAPTTPHGVCSRLSSTYARRWLAKSCTACTARFPGDTKCHLGNGQCRWCRPLCELRVSRRFASDTSEASRSLRTHAFCFANSIDEVGACLVVAAHLGTPKGSERQKARRDRPTAAPSGAETAPRRLPTTYNSPILAKCSTPHAAQVC